MRRFQSSQTRRFVARVDSATCTGCGQCVEECPVEAITVLEAAVVDESRCIGCGACVEVCPIQAITLVARGDQRGAPQ
ncbi:MAG: 4Fe-4S binding protein [Phycisphaerae bacterium]|nr:4Fe-4S binding protein [Phycisphaerae bacterium]